MKLLFTGASGFLGSIVCPLLRENYNVATIGLLRQDDYIVDIAKKYPYYMNDMMLYYMLLVRLILCLRLKRRGKLFLM